MGRILAIDLGLRRSGLAWTDPEGKVALPLEGVETAHLWDKLSLLLPEVSQVLIGYPRRLSGQPTEMTQPVEAFFQEFQRRFPTVPVTLVEERLSTQGALRLLSQHTRKHRRSKPHHDAMAAWILLDSYLGGGRV